MNLYHMACGFVNTDTFEYLDHPKWDSLQIKINPLKILLKSMLYPCPLFSLGGQEY